jgi:hypothetical protein
LVDEWVVAKVDKTARRKVVMKVEMKVAEMVHRSVEL